MFSIVIPLYNKEKQIANTIKSVQNQTFQEFEIVIVNDGSTDNSVEIVKQIDDKRIKLINQENTGVSSARNTGIKNASFDYIALLDGDDEWKDNFLKEINILIHKYPYSSIFSTNYLIRKNNVDRTIKINGLEEGFTDGIIKDYFSICSNSEPLICSSSIVFKKEAINYVKGFPLNIKSGEDLITWAKLSSNFILAYSVKPLVIINSMERPISNRRENDIEDYVYLELMNIKEQFKTKEESVNNYMYKWLIIRCSIFLETGDVKNAKKTILQILKFKRISLKTVVFFILSFLPSKLSKKLYHKFREKR